MSRPLLALVLIVIVISMFLGSFGLPLPVRAEPPKNVPKELLKKRLEAARSVYTQKLAQLKSGEAKFDATPFFWCERLLDSELALVDKPEDQIALYSAHLQRAKDLETIAANQAQLIHDSDVQAAKYFRLDAEINLLEAKAE